MELNHPAQWNGTTGEEADEATADATDEDSNIWSSLLSEVQASDRNKLPSNKTLVVLGDNESGKTSLIHRLHGIEEPKRGLALEYHYIPVKDDYREDKTNLGVWVLNGEANFSHLLDFAINPWSSSASSSNTTTTSSSSSSVPTPPPTLSSFDSFHDTVVLLVASIDRPWSIIDSLSRWTQLLRDHINKLEISPEQIKAMESRIVRLWQSYAAPDEVRSLSSSVSHGSISRSTTGSNMATSVASSSGGPPGGGGKTSSSIVNSTSSNLLSDDSSMFLPLAESVLTHNLGVQLIVVITKTDAMSSLEKEHDYKEEHFDFVQQHIRKFCLHYGASLFYVSVKEDKNIETLYRYLMHTIYGFPFSTPALVVDRDGVFVPAGWDNEKKLGFLYENLVTMSSDDPYEDVIVKPIHRRPLQRDAEVHPEPEQDFLQRQLVLLSKQPTTPSLGVRDASPSGSATSGGASSPKLSSAGGTPRRGSSSGAKKPTDGAENKMLADFFNSLLNKKTAPAAGEKAAVTRNAAAKLEEMRQSSAAAAAGGGGGSASSPGGGNS